MFTNDRQLIMQTDRLVYFAANAAEKVGKRSTVHGNWTRVQQATVELKQIATLTISAECRQSII